MEIIIKNVHFINEYDSKKTVDKDLQITDDDNGILQLNFVDQKGLYASNGSILSLNKSEAIALSKVLDSFISSDLLKDEF